MTICANYTKRVSCFCALCRMVSGLAVVWCCVLSWCGSVARCEAFLASFYGFMVSSTSTALKWLCGRSGASGRVSRCRHGVGCGCLWLWCGAVTLCEVILACFRCLVVSGLAVCLWWSLWLFWCAVRGAVSLVLSGGLVCCLLVFSGGLFSGLVFWCLVIVLAGLKRFIHEKDESTLKWLVFLLCIFTLYLLT